MKLQEYQSRDLLSAFEIPIARGVNISDAAAARKAFESLGGTTCIMKVQVLMGGRGKAGGVKRIQSADEAARMADQFIGKPFSTYQSQGQSQTVRSILVTEDIPILKEYYLGIAIDRSQGQPVILFSTEGGVEIEEVALKNPKAIQRIHFPPNHPPKAADILSSLPHDLPDPAIARQIAEMAVNLSRLFVEKDASIVEINPLAVTPGNRVYALDAKIIIDDNALFRHEALQKLKDPEEDDAREKKAKTFGLSYVSMTGNVGCLVNGAGLAMATMDVIKHAGGEPANFLDVGGSATAEQVREGFKIILQDERVEAILVNIFGGIMKCDVIAEGVIQASKEIQSKVPLVVRLEGNRVEEGRALLKQSGLKIISCQTINEAAATAVREANQYRQSHVDINR